MVDANMLIRIAMKILVVMILFPSKKGEFDLRNNFGMKQCILILCQWGNILFQN